MFRVFLLTTLLSLVVSALVGIGIFILGNFGDTETKLLLTTLAVGVFSLTGLASALRGGSWWLWALRPLGIAVSIIALTLVVLRIWSLMEDDQATWRAIGTFTVLAGTLAHLSLLGVYWPRSTWPRLWHSGALAASVALAAVIIAGIYLSHLQDYREPYLRLVGVVAILDILGTVGLAPLSRLTRSHPARSAAPAARSRRRRPARVPRRPAPAARR